MTLLEVINRIRAVALAQPSVRQVVDNEIRDINAIPDAEYGVFGYIQQPHRLDEQGVMTYSFWLYYIDRLTEDESNELYVQSTAIETLASIVRTLGDTFGTGEVTFTTFGRRFADLCAGAYCNVELTTAIGFNCGGDYEED